MIWSKFGGEFVDVIEWTDDSKDTLVYRFERYGNEIKYGAKLTVRPGQIAVFVNEGKLADTFSPGMYTLETQNVPILSTLQGWKHGFESPFKAEVYFVSTRRFTDLKWGTKNPIIVRDKEFDMVRLRAYGTYEIKVNDASMLIHEIVGTDGHFTTDEISNQLRNLIVSRFSDVVAESGIPLLDMAANYTELSDYVTREIGLEVAQYGLELTKLLVENISLPPAVEEALDRRSSMGIVGDLKKYTQFQAAEAMRDAARNPGGDAGAGIGMGMGFAMAKQMADAMANPAAPPPPAPAPAAPVQPPPPPAGAVQYYLAENGQRQGPFGLDALKQKAQSGAVNKQTMVWAQGMTAWQKAGEVAELQSLFSAPPPLPGATTASFYVAENGQQAGPFRLETLREWAGDGVFTRATLVWREGMNGWQAAGEVDILQDLFKHLPPPLPSH